MKRDREDYGKVNFKRIYITIKSRVLEFLFDCKKFYKKCLEAVPTYMYVHVHVTARYNFAKPAWLQKSQDDAKKLFQQS